MTSNVCQFKLCLPKKTISALQGLLKTYPDNEVIGHLHFKPRKNKITELELDEKVHVGDGTSVNVDLPANVKKLLIDCHTHPPKAYEIYNTVIGYPSKSDYETILENIITNDQLFHILVAKEGLYIIQLHQTILKDIPKNKKKSYSEKFLETHSKYIKKISKTKKNMKFPACFNLDMEDACISGTPQTAAEKYTEMVNKGKLFYIQFIPYDGKSKEIVVFSKKCHNLKTQFNFRYI